MASDFDLSIMEIDDLLQHLYLKLKGKKEGLSLAEPAAILLARLRKINPSFYGPQIARFTPVIMDTLISGAYISFGYEGLQSLNEVAGNISLATGEYIPDGVEEGLSMIRGRIDSIEKVLSGKDAGAGDSSALDEDELAGTSGFTRERAWGTVGLPLVSTYNTGKTPFSTGRVVMARIEVRLTGEWSIRSRHDPVINFEHVSADPNSSFELQVRTAIIAAERYAAGKMRLKGLFRIPREYRISLPEIASFPASAIQRLSGGSAGLAIAALLVSTLSRLDLYRQKMNVTPGTSFTGAVDEYGKILAVEESHISDKVRAVFFSNFSRLLLPEDNLETAAKALALLAKNYPARRLELVPVYHISDLFGDSCSIEVNNVPFGKPAFMRMFLWRKHLLTAVSLAAAAVIALLFILPYNRRDIGEVSLGKDRIFITNKFGRLITEYETEFMFENELKTFSRIFIGDFDGNGENEAVCALTESPAFDPSTSYNRLHIISFDNKGDFRFRYIYDDAALLADQMDPYGSGFAISTDKHSMILYDEDGKSRLILLTHHGSRGPGGVINISLHDFSKQIFMHRGYLSNLSIADINNDGLQDLVLAGYNIPLESCVVVVLDPRLMHGSSPKSFGYTAGDFANDIAKYYLRLPNFHRYIPRTHNNWFPLTPRIRTVEDGIGIEVRSNGNNVYFVLDEYMRGVRAEVLESFAEKEINKSERPAVYDYPGKDREENDLISGIRYWDGGEWTTRPAMNRTYLANAGADIDSTVTRVDIAGGGLVMKNAQGEIIATYEEEFNIPKSGPFNKIFFGDFIDDEGDEIVCAFFNTLALERNDYKEARLYICVFDRRGRLLRRHVYHENSILGPEAGRAALQIRMMMQPDTSPFRKELGPGYLYVLAHHKTEPPASLIKFSIDDGSYETFFHKGYLSKMATRDVDGDGSSELLLLGYNVALDAMVIIALDPDHLEGSSPEGSDYEIPGHDEDIAKYYIRLPFYNRFVRFNYTTFPLHINFFENAAVLRIMVESREEEVIFSIGRNMVFTEADIVRKDQESRTIVPAVFPGVEKDEQELLRGIRFWNGESWVAGPAVNRSYLKNAREGI